MSGYFYRGRHRAPVEHFITGKTIATGAAAAALTLPGLAVLGSGEAQADILDEIERCESGGRNVPNASGASTASGFFQFLDGTWQGLGYSGRAMDHSYATQREAAEKLYAQAGTTPWNASSDCWGGSGGGAVETRSAPAAPAPAREGGKHRAPEGVTNGRAADGSGSYVCSTDTLHFEACDPHNLGETVQYPLYDGHGKHSSGVVKTASAKPGKHRAGPPADLDRRDSNGHGSYVCDTARLGYAACDPDTLGQRVQYPAFD